MGRGEGKGERWSDKPCPDGDYLQMATSKTEEIKPLTEHEYMYSRKYLLKKKSL